MVSAQGSEVTDHLLAYPSSTSFCSFSTYCSHKWPITRPQVKQRTGMIIFRQDSPLLLAPLRLLFCVSTGWRQSLLHAAAAPLAPYSKHEKNGPAVTGRRWRADNLRPRSCQAVEGSSVCTENTSTPETVDPQRPEVYSKSARHRKVVTPIRESHISKRQGKRELCPKQQSRGCGGDALAGVASENLLAVTSRLIAAAKKSSAKMEVDLLHPDPTEEAKKHKLKRLIPNPKSFFMDVKCPGCYNIATVFSHAQTVVLCGSFCIPMSTLHLSFVKLVWMAHARPLVRLSSSLAWQMKMIILQRHALPADRGQVQVDRGLLLQEES
ncbi:hypothetical protein Esti_006468 [Eimeria stiedai]